MTPSPSPRHGRRQSDAASGAASPPDAPPAPGLIPQAVRDHWGKALVGLALTVGGLQQTVAQKADATDVQALRVEVRGLREDVNAKLDVILCDRFPNPINCTSEVAGRIRALGGVPADDTRGRVP